MDAQCCRRTSGLDPGLKRLQTTYGCCRFRSREKSMALLTSLLVYHRNISLEKERIRVKRHSK